MTCFKREGFERLGPDRKAAILEASKDFAKRLMAENGIPTAAYRTFEDADTAIAYLEEINAPVFVKADGLAAGKGVIPGLTLDARR